MAIPYAGDTWHLEARNLMTRLGAIDGSVAGATVTYTLTRNGSALGSGSLTWEPTGFQNAWAAPITLPATAGPLVAKVVASAVIGGVPVRGTIQESIQVV